MRRLRFFVGASASLGRMLISFDAAASFVATAMLLGRENHARFTDRRTEKHTEAHEKQPAEKGPVHDNRNIAFASPF